MSGDRGPADRPSLEDLAHRARTELRDWTDRTDSDPGIALLELFAFVAELLTLHSERLASELYLGTGSRATHGVHRATVLDNTDPLMRWRLFVRVPDLSGDQGVWASACLPVGGTTEVPGIGDGVWVALESGDPSRPVWLGQRVTD